MIKIEFAIENLQIISNLQKNSPHPFVRQKALVLLLKANNIPHNKIAEICNITENTVRNYLYGYRDAGINSLTEVPFNKPQSELAQFETIIRGYFDETPPSSIKQACAELKEILMIEIGETQLINYIKSIGVKYRKVAGIPAKVDCETQKKFHDNELLPSLEEAKEGKREVYFVDAAHFVLGAFLSFLWSFKRIFVKTPSGRQRFNVLGALNATTKKIISIKNETYITSIQVCELLKKIHLQAKLPITIVLDNAKYQRCKLVQGLAAELNIELLFLPAYSPNLNLIERFWKLTKKNCLNSKYYKDFIPFKESITTFVDNAHLTHKKEMESLLTLKFQLFSEEQIKEKTKQKTEALFKLAA